jgi:hypothetical protein
VRFDEIEAMRVLSRDHKVVARSSRQVRLGLYPDLPWVGDVAETYGISLLVLGGTTPDEDNERDEIAEWFAQAGIVDEFEDETEQ